MESYEKDAALAEAVEAGDLEAVQQLLGSGLNFDSAGLGLLVIVAIGEGHAEIAKLLLGWGADPNARDANDATALHHAALNGNADVVRLLLDRGADPYAADKIGETPLETAAIFNQSHIVELLIKRGADLSVWGTPALLAAAFNNAWEAIEVLLAHGVDIDARDAHGRTARSMAQERGYMELVARLLSLGG